MSEINSHVILSCIDAPARILIWPANQVLVCSLPFAFGMVTEHVFVGLAMSFLSAVLFKIKLLAKVENGFLEPLIFRS